MECDRGYSSVGIRSICLDPSFRESVRQSIASALQLYVSQILCVIPVPIVRWALVGIAFGLSGFFLIRNVYPILATVSALIFSLRTKF